VGGRIRFALERWDSPRHSSHVAQLFTLGHISRAMYYEPGAEGLKDTTMGRFALKFAHRLVAREYAEAHSMLSSSLRSALTPADLERKLEAMIASGDGWPDLVEATTGDEDWPAKEPHDLGWVYVSICGDGFVEAVTVTIALENDTEVIRSIEWGRP